MRLLPNILASILIFAFAATVASRYYHYAVERDFLLKADIACDPAVQACFAINCEPDDPDCDPAPFAKAKVRAKDAPVCFEEHSCRDFSCDGRRDCATSFCAPDALGEGEHCVGPNGEAP